MAHGSSGGGSASSAAVTAANAPSMMQVQHQIRANASELQDYFSDLYSWEAKIQKEEALRNTLVPRGSANTPLPRGQTRATVRATAPAPKHSASTGEEKAGAARKADAHTYDRGYKKWDKFDVDAALRDVDGEGTKAFSNAASTPAPSKAGAGNINAKATTAATTPGKSREDIEREEGNEHYKRADYVAAIKSYTRCLGFNSRNAVVLSNRAMAYLKNREYSKAEDDCSLALKLDASHVKSYARRGTARNALGKHRLALLDFQRAAELDPKGKQNIAQIVATKELMRTAIKRAPKRTQFDIQVIGESKPVAAVIIGDASESSDKENSSPPSNLPAPEAPIANPTRNEHPTLSQAPRKSMDPAPAPSALPKLPKKAPTTAYQFARVWKTLAPKGDAARKHQLWRLRGEYLRLLSPSSLPTVFKNSIESDILCEIFAAVRRVMDVSGVDNAFVFELVTQFACVPRFSMTVMFLSDAEKEDLVGVFNQLSQRALSESDTTVAEKVKTLKAQYCLP